MDDQIQEDPKVAQVKAAIIREMERRSLDRCEVYNPMEEPYTVIWDSRAHTVNPHESAIFFRYIAEKFLKEVVDKILFDRQQAEVGRINKKRVDSGQARMNPRERSEIEGSMYFKISEPSLRRPLVREVWKGVKEEYGMNDIIIKNEPRHVDPRPIDEQLIEEIDRVQMVHNEEEEIAKQLIDSNFIENESMDAQPESVTLSEEQKRKDFGQRMKEAREAAREKREALQNEQPSGI